MAVGIVKGDSFALDLSPYFAEIRISEDNVVLFMTGSNDRTLPEGWNEIYDPVTSRSIFWRTVEQ